MNVKGLSIWMHITFLVIKLMQSIRHFFNRLKVVFIQIAVKLILCGMYFALGLLEISLNALMTMIH